MALDEPKGVTITLREIFDEVQRVGSSVDKLASDVDQLKSESKENEKALEIAEKAHALAMQHEERYKWLSRLVIGSLITTLITALVGLMIFALRTTFADQQPDNIQIENPKDESQSEEEASMPSIERATELGVLSPRITH